MLQLSRFRETPLFPNPEGPGNRREAPPIPRAGLGEECATARPVPDDLILFHVADDPAAQPEFLYTIRVP